MKPPAEVSQWLQEQGFGIPSDLKPVGGGCINNGLRLTTESSHSFFLKLNDQAPSDMFMREAEGIRALTVDGGPRVPAVHLVGEEFLLLEDLSPTNRQAGYWEAFGRSLAKLHDHHHPRFGFDQDNYLGSTPQPNQWTDDGHRFFAEHRLLYQGELANRKGLLQKNQVKRIEQLADRLPDLIPDQPASLIHGDLWSGNAITDSRGAPAIIDPATHYGWAEAELGMTVLFGGFAEPFYRAYENEANLTEGWRQRLPIYNLYHLLNHLNLFGPSYLGQVESILARYSE